MGVGRAQVNLLGRRLVLSLRGFPLIKELERELAARTRVRDHSQHACLLLSPWPIEVLMNWLERVNQNEDEQELESLRPSVQRGRPFGQPEWRKEIAKRLGLESAY